MILNKKEKLVSVIMSIYSEKERWLKESIDSVLNQSYTNFEFIIINDNPERKLNTSILNNFKLIDKRIIVINNQKNFGLTKSLNIGLKIAKGEYIARMDADDICNLNRLKKQVFFLELHKDIGFCGSYVKLFSDDLSIFNKKLMYPVNDKQIRVQMLFSNALAHPTIMLRKALFMKNNALNYNESLKRAQDYDIWSRALVFTKGFNMPEFLLDYRISVSQISSLGKKEQNSVANLVRKGNLNSILNVTDYELTLHNNSCNQIRFNNQKEITDLENWFLKLEFAVSKKKEFNSLYLNLKANLLLIETLITYYKGFKSFTYFQTKLFRFSPNKTKKIKDFLMIFFKFNIKKYLVR